MPTYEYVCSNCGNEWEEVQRISEPPLESCPKCGKATAKRQISGGTFILKGGGWYADLYSSSKPAKKDDGTGAGDAKAKDGAGDSKSKEGAASESKAKEGGASAEKTEVAASPKTGSSSSGGGGDGKSGAGAGKASS
jgi:putative FmdB family regulatory protein